MSRNEILEKLKDVFSMITGIEKEKIEIGEDSNLANDVGLNSVGLLYLVIGIEDVFGIRFENLGISDFKYVSDVIDYIVKETA